MGEIEIIANNLGKLRYIRNEKKFVGCGEYVKLREEKINELFRHGCIINVNGVYYADYMHEQTEGIRIELDNEKIALIASGKCKVSRVNGIYPMAVKFIGNFLEVNLFGDEYSETLVNIDNIVKTCAQHRIIGDKISIEGILGGQALTLYNKDNVVLKKNCNRLRAYDIGNLDSYDIEFMSETRPCDSNVDETINRWNTELKNGRFVVYSDNRIELYVNIDKDIVENALKNMSGK